jgi:hypothetical protein
VAIFCPVGCATEEFANGFCSAHYAEWIAKLAEATLAERRELEDMHTRRWVEMRSGEQDGRSVARLKRGGVPATIIQSLRGMRSTEQVEAARQLGRKEISLLLLLGTPGTGKSTALAVACAEVARRWPWSNQPGGGRALEPFMFVHASAFDGLDGIDRREEWERCYLLCIDEMGREGTPSVQRVVDIVIKRHGLGRPTAMASNMRPQAWRARYGEGLVDRIKADGRNFVIKADSMRAT